MLNTEAGARIAHTLRSTIAYAAGISESTLTESTRLAELGIDSVAILAAGVVLGSELDVDIPDEDIVRIFASETVSDAIAVTCEVYEVIGT